MATQLKTFTAVRRTQVQRQGRYPWADWGNGEVWEIRRGTDYDCTTIGMRSTLYQRATKIRQRVIVQRIDDGCLEFQFSPE